jgi:hypothetical protein
LDTIPVAPGEVLSMDGEVLWIEVDGLAGAFHRMEQSTRQ